LLPTKIRKYFILANSHIVQSMIPPDCEHCSDKVSNNKTVGTELEITLASGETFIGTLTAADPTRVLAVVGMSTDSALPVAAMSDSDALRPGKVLVAVGSPLQVLSNSCRSGITPRTSRMFRKYEVAKGRTMSDGRNTENHANKEEIYEQIKRGLGPGGGVVEQGPVIQRAIGRQVRNHILFLTARGGHGPVNV
jgi:S1-C subfamily serine protease